MNADPAPPVSPSHASTRSTATGIEIEDLCVAYESGPPVLDHLDLNVAAGEIVALVGASGCGKSTLLRAIAGLIPSQSGEIRFTGGASTSQLSFVFQDATLLPWRTVRENVLLPLELANRGLKLPFWRRWFTQRNSGTLPELVSRVEEALKAVGLEAEAWDRFPRELSGGMRMRNSIARALVTDPDVLLLDEPFAALDEFLRNRLNDLLLQLWQQRSRTVVFVTHNIAEAVYLSHRIAVVDRGRIASCLSNRLDWPRSPSQRSTVDFAQMYGEVSSELSEVER
jgi:NitT/TauT family transport system ATP-binding protein